jgi:hypothetical protein
MNVRAVIALAPLTAALAGCSGGLDGGNKPPPPPPSLPPPTIEHVSPGVGISGTPFSLDVYGTYFRDPSIAGRSLKDGPTVVVSRIRDLDGVAVDGPGASQVAIVETVGGRNGIASITVDTSALPVGVYSLSLRTVAGLDVRREEAFVILPRPAVTSLDHPLLCDPHMSRLYGGPRPETLGINGTNLYKLPPLVPGVALGGRGPNRSLRPTVIPDAVSGCRSVQFPGGESCFLSQLGLLCARFTGAELCTRVEAHFPDIDLTSHMVVAVVPPLLESIAPDATFDLFTDLFVEEPAPLPSQRLFSAVDAQVGMPLWFGGYPLIVGPTAAPAVRIDGAPFPATATDCAPSGASGVDLCRGLIATLPQGFAPGNHLVELTTATGCAAAASFASAPRPVIRTVTPSTICERSTQQTVFLQGDGFVAPDVFIDGKYEPFASGCVPAPGNSSCLSVNLVGDRLSLGPHKVEVENRSTPLIRSAPATVNVVTGPPFRGRPSPNLVYADGLRKVFVPVFNVTGHLVSARLLAFATAIPVEIAEVPGGAELTIPASAGAGAYQIEISDESPCPGGDPGGSFLFTTDNPVVRSLDFDTQASASRARTVTVTGEPGPAVTWLQNQGNPGSAIGASRDAAGPDWYFVLDVAWDGGMDLGLLRFDLRATNSAGAATAPGVLLTNFLFRVEHAILPPPLDGSWAHYELSLQSADGWTYRDAAGSRAATLSDLRTSMEDVRVLGSWSQGAGSAALDNVAVELAR